MLLILPLAESVRVREFQEKTQRKGSENYKTGSSPSPSLLKRLCHKKEMVFFTSGWAEAWRNWAREPSQCFFCENQQVVVTMVPGPSEKRCCMYSTVLDFLRKVYH